MTTPAELAAKIAQGNTDLDNLFSAINDAPGTFTVDDGTIVDNLRKRLDAVETSATASAAAAAASEVNTAADAVQTAADRVQTGLDATSTAADVVTTDAAKTAAENAQLGAEAALDQFDDLYLGAKTADPALDNDGDPLQDGVWYHNSTLAAIRVYNLGTTTWYTGTHTPTDVGGEITAAPAAAISDPDELGFSVAGVLRKITWTNFKTAIRAILATEALAGVLKIATQAKAVAGTDDVDAMTALKLRQGLNATGSAPIFAARAWANYDLTGAVLRDSGNVTSVTKNGTGDCTVNFATAMNSVNYSPAITTGNVASYAVLTTTTMQILNKSAGGTLTDTARISASVLGD